MNEAFTKAAGVFHAAVKEILELRADTQTAPGELASRMSIAREVVSIAAVRLATARAQAAAENAAALYAQSRKAAAEAERLEAEAEHMDRTAAGTVAGLYGDAITELLRSRGKRCLKAIELRTQAANARGIADAAESDARSTERVAPAAITKNKIRFTGTAPEHLAAGLEDVLAALSDGRLEV